MSHSPAPALLHDSRAFCMMPWVHLHVDTRGRVQACCVGQIPFGNINESPLHEIWQGAAIRDFRLRMLRDEPHPGCRVCYAREAAGAVSMRQEVNRDFAGHFPTVASTRPEGTAPGAKPVYWDIRFSNLCNFRCRTCWHGASSRWYEEAKALGNTAGPQAVIRAARDPESFLRQLELLLPEVEEIYFAGGEPLLMDEHYALLQALLDMGRTEVRLRYNTNFSRLDHGGHDLAGMWNRFDSVTVGASLDAMGELGEYIRKEQRWEKVLANRRTIMEKCPRLRFEVHPTVSVFNVAHLPNFHRHWVEAGLMDLDAMVPNLLERPDHCNIKVLLPGMKAEVQERYQVHQAWLLEKGASHETKSRFREITDFMAAEDWSAKWPKFLEETAKLDELRR